MELKPLSIMVRDVGGYLITFEREDETAFDRYAMAHGKGFGSVMLGMAGTALMVHRYFRAAVDGGFGGSVISEPGGILLRVPKGAAGVIGDVPDNDAQVGRTGIEAARVNGVIWSSTGTRNQCAFPTNFLR